MTVTSNATSTNPAGVTNTGGGNTYAVVQVSQANSVSPGSDGLHPHAANSFIKSASDGSVDVGILQVQGYPIITTNSGNTNYQITFGFPGATTASNTATFTGSINGTSLTISSSVTGGNIQVGMILTWTGSSGTTIITAGTGTTWSIFPSTIVASGTTFTATISPSGTPGFMTVGLNASNAIQTQFFGETFAPVVAAQTFAGAYAGATTTSRPTITSGNGTWTITGSTTLSPSSAFNVGTSGGGGSATTLYGTLTVSNATVVNSNFTLNGSTNASTEQFNINNGTASTAITTGGSFTAYAGNVNTAFNVDSATGNTFIGGTLQVGTTANALYFQVDNSGNVTIRGNLTVTGTQTTVNNETVNNSETITQTLTVSSTNDVGNVSGASIAAAGGATIAKQLQVGGATTLNGNTSVTGSNTFSVGTGASTLGGTLGVSGIGSFTNLSLIHI